MIGILDSGLGGLAAAASIRSHLPDYDLLYFGDTANGPSGVKSADAAARFALSGARYLADRSVRLLLVTSSGIAAATEGRLAQLCGIPVFDPLQPGAVEAAARSRKGAVGVIGSPLTLHTRAYAGAINAVDPAIRVHEAACPLLPHLVEEGRLRKPETIMIIRKYLLPLKSRQIDALILGSAHYLPLSGIIARKAGKRVAVIDPFEAMAGSVRRFLKETPDLDGQLPKNGTLRVLLSDIPPGAKKTARLLLGQNLELEPTPPL